MTPHHRGLTRKVTGAAALRALAGATLQAQARDPAALASGWVRESWSIADGIPVNSITSLLQGPTGCLGATTFDGLIRFELHPPPMTPAAPSRQ